MSQEGNDLVEGQQVFGSLVVKVPHVSLKYLSQYPYP